MRPPRRAREQGSPSRRWLSRGPRRSRWSESRGCRRCPTRRIGVPGDLDRSWCQGGPAPGGGRCEAARVAEGSRPSTARGEPARHEEGDPARPGWETLESVVELSGARSQDPRKRGREEPPVRARGSIVPRVCRKLKPGTVGIPPWGRSGKPSGLRPAPAGLDANRPAPARAGSGPVQGRAWGPRGPVERAQGASGAAKAGFTRASTSSLRLERRRWSSCWRRYSVSSALLTSCGVTKMTRLRRSRVRLV